MFVHSLAIKLYKRGPMNPAGRIFVIENEGIIGDCRGGGGFGRKRQITLISLEQWEEACSEIATNIPVSSRRANVCVVGHSFGPGDVGKKFHANGVVLEITGETKPCGRMDEVAPGLRKALEKDWRGGVTCRVVSGGVIEQNHVASIGD